MKRNTWLIPITIVATAFVFTVAVGQNTSSGSPRETKDTIPQKKTKMRDIDDAMLEVDLSKAEIEKAMKEVDWQKIEKDIKQAMASMKVDMGKMQEEMKQALKEIDAVKIQADVDKALKDVDTEKIKATIDKALKEIDTEKIRKDVQEAVARIDMKEINKELEKVKNIDFSKLEEDMKKMKPELEKTLSEARVSIEAAKKELTAYKGFINDLEKEGLINKKNDYTIEYKSGELSVNGKKIQPEVQQKFSSFLKDRKDFTIKKNEDGFNMNN